MSDSEVHLLKQRVAELEKEVSDREADLSSFRKNLATANKRLEGLIGQIQSELKIAHRIQSVLVPTEYPNIPGFEFSSKFVSSMVTGGDYFDIFEHENRFRFGVIVASSSGHSMSALLLSVLLKLAGQIEARRGAPPDVVMGQLVQELQAGSQGNDSADIFYGVIDRRSYDLTYCGLGEVVAVHNPYGESELQSLMPCGGPVRQGQEVEELSTKTISLNPKDQLVFCTKGVLESPNLEGEHFGKERLFDAIVSAPRQGVHELRNEILYRAEKHGAGQEPKRDQTVVVMEVKDRVIKLAKK